MTIIKNFLERTNINFNIEKDLILDGLENVLRYLQSSKFWFFSFLCLLEKLFNWLYKFNKTGLGFEIYFELIFSLFILFVQMEKFEVYS